MREEHIESTSDLTYPAVASDKSDVSAVELLTAQHREVEQLFAEIEALDEKAYKKKESTFKIIAEKLTMHAKLEEKLFYPEIKSHEKTATLEAYEEHSVVKDLIKRIARTKVQHESWPAKVKFLKEIVQHHVEEEEDELFPAWEESSTFEELERVGREMQMVMQKKKPAKGKKRARSASRPTKTAKSTKSSDSKRRAYH